jgi:hypothetical protein
LRPHLVNNTAWRNRNQYELHTNTKSSTLETMAKFRKPSEMTPNETRVPVSARIRESLRNDLAKMAKAHKLSLGELMENILEDYGKFIRER